MYRAVIFAFFAGVSVGLSPWGEAVLRFAERELGYPATSLDRGLSGCAQRTPHIEGPQ